MVWFKVDDKLAVHPKTMLAGNAAMGLWVRAGSWCAAHSTDGKVPTSMLVALGGRPAHADALVKAGLWATEPDGWRFHDWLDWQPSAHDVGLGEDAMRQGATKGNHLRWHVRRGITDPDCVHCAARTEFDALAARRNPDFDTASALEWDPLDGADRGAT